MYRWCPVALVRRLSRLWLASRIGQARMTRETPRSAVFSAILADCSQRKTDRDRKVGRGSRKRRKILASLFFERLFFKFAGLLLAGQQVDVIPDCDVNSLLVESNLGNLLNDVSKKIS